MTKFSKNLDKAALVCDRYQSITRGDDGELPEGYERKNLLLDLLAADGVNGNLPLDWDRLLSFDDFNLIHDVGGVSACMDRTTGKLGRFFVPRCARVQ